MRIPPPPLTPREEVTDTWHGDRVVDPYRWLENTDSERTRRWTDAQNARTREILDARIAQRLDTKGNQVSWLGFEAIEPALAHARDVVGR